MLWLPPLSNVGEQAPIAVSDSSAAVLEATLLEGDRRTAASWLIAAMVVDPWFCRWASEWTPDRPDSISSLADAFASRAPALLRSGLASYATQTDHAPPWSRPDPQVAGRLAAFAGLALANAKQTAGDCDEVAKSALFLTAMIAVGQTGEPTDLGPPTDEYLDQHEGIEWRLPRLIEQFTKHIELETEFDTRLERAKLDAMKELAYGASHEINNPLANISGRAQSLLRDESDPARRRLLAAIDAQAMRAHEMISDLMLFARPPALVKQSSDVDLVVEVVVKELSEQAEAQQVVMEYNSPEQPIIASVDSTQLSVAVQAVVRNALEAIGHDGRILIELAPDSENSQFSIVVSDNGPGISDNVRRHLFDPFYSGREAGRGLGFGLSKCWRIITDHGGSVAVASRPEGGAAITIRLPVGEIAPAESEGA